MLLHSTTTGNGRERTVAFKEMGTHLPGRDGGRSSS